MIKLYNQNIWGNYGKGQSVANRNELIAKMTAEYAPDFIHFQECNPRTSRAPEVDIARMISGRYTEAAAEHAHENFTPGFLRPCEVRLHRIGFHALRGTQ